MKEFALAIVLLKDGCISSVLTYDDKFVQLLGYTSTALLGAPITQVFPGISPVASNIESAYINAHWIQYSLRKLPEQHQLLILIWQESNIEKIYQSALDCMDMGIQIYMEDTTLLFMNTASEEMSGIRRGNVMGKALTDIYDTDRVESSVLAALDTRTSIYNKLDHFKVRGGTVASVLNTSIPIFDERGTIEAVINLEQTQQSIAKVMATTRIMEQIIPTSKEKSSDTHSYYRFCDIIGTSPSLQEAIDVAKLAVSQQSSAFIIGETGTGKELFAQSIYSACSTYKAFVSVNCGTISESLADATLFGTVKGAFTGSVNAQGLFSAADGGLLFLDELNSLSLSTQARLLRVLQEGSYMKVGAVTETSCQVRVIASCNQDPWDLMKAGKLREDLFYRLASTIIKIPPLRQRYGDVPQLITYFLAYYSKKFNKQVSSISERALAYLEEYPWPGNVRELKNVIEFSVTATHTDSIDSVDFPGYIQNKFRYGLDHIQKAQKETSLVPKSLTLQTERYERYLIEKYLRANKYNISKTAQDLSLSRQALQYKLKKYHFEIT